MNIKEVSRLNDRAQRNSDILPVLRYVIHYRRTFRNLNLSYILITDSMFYECKFINCNFEGAYINAANAIRCKFKKCNFKKVVTNEVNIHKSTFKNCITRKMGGQICGFTSQETSTEDLKK